MDISSNFSIQKEKMKNMTMVSIDLKTIGLNLFYLGKKMLKIDGETENFNYSGEMDKNKKAFGKGSAENDSGKIRYAGTFMDDAPHGVCMWKSFALIIIFHRRKMHSAEG